MNKELLDFIKSLTENDKKNLVGKALKTSEEVGELAKAVLPYENASGTLHRFVQRRQILENAIDVMLCAYSIAYDLKYDDDEIESMMNEKAAKWANIQAKEGRIKFPLPYEIHITVKDARNSFKEDCASLKVKPIIIELEKDGVIVMNDVMTSSVHFGDNNSAIEAANQLATQLSLRGYNVARIKIETVPWHPAAPSVNDDHFHMPLGNYFESHLRIVTTKDRRDKLEEIADIYEAHLSRNFFKKLNENEFIIMMTLRSKNVSSEIFSKDVDNLKDKLISSGFVVDKTEIEFAVYDTNVNHDIEWIKK